MVRRYRLLLALFSVLVVACGGDDGGGDDGNDLLDWLLDGGGQDTRTRDVGATTDAATRPDGAGFDAILPQPDTDAEDDVDTGPRPYGAPCEIDRDCAGGLCLRAPDWPEGTCSTRVCTDEILCGEGAECTRVAGETRCLAACDGDDACRDGYVCLDIGPGGAVCVPEDNAFLGSGDGAACASDADCAGRVCLPSPEYPGGHCTSLFCTVPGDCAALEGPTECIATIGVDTKCMRYCDTDADCRDGYVCLPSGDEGGYCDVDVPVIIPPTAENSPLPFACGFAATGSRALVTFELPAGVTNVGLSVYAADGQPFVLGQLTSGDGSVRTLDRYRYDSRWPVYAQVFGPGAFATGLTAGTYTLELETTSQDLCALAVPESEPGTVLDINVYVLGVEGETWQTMADNANWQRLLGFARTVFAGAGITLRDVRYPPIPADALPVIIRSDSAVGQAAEDFGSLPADTQDGTLSIDLFLVRGINMGGVLGMSPLTGAMGVHGLRWTGLAMTSEYLGAGALPFSDAGDSEQYLAMVLVHEVGHYLGLPHVNEDRNVMLPIAGVSHTQWNNTQVLTMLANPLTKTEPFVDLPDPREGSGD